MKINLLHDSNELRSGYVNVDPFDVSNDKKVCASPYELYFCAPNEAEEILCNDILCYYTKQECEQILIHIVERLHHGGLITISDTNAYEVARMYVLEKINLDQYTDLIFGTTHPKKSTINLSNLVRFFVERGFKVVSKALKDTKFVLKVQRP